MSVPHLFITFLIAVIIYLYSLKEEFNVYGGDKDYLNEGQTVNKALLEKIKGRIKENCGDLRTEKIKSNIMSNKRVTCRYFSRCKDITEINVESWNKPKLIPESNIIGVPA